METSMTSTLASYFAAADHARAGYQWEEAIEIYSEALALPDLAPGDKYALLDGRAFAYQRLGKFQSELADLEDMANLVAGEPDEERDLLILVRKGIALSFSGNTEQLRAVRERLLDLARSANSPYFTGQAHYLLGLDQSNTGKYLPATDNFLTAMQIFNGQDALVEEAWCAFNISYCASFTGQDGEPYAERVFEIARQLNDRLLEGRAYHAMCFGVRDNPTQFRSYVEKALEIYQQIDERRAVATMYHNLAEIYMDNGLYKRAFSLYRQSLGMFEPKDARSGYLLTLYRAGMAGFLSGHIEDGLEMNERALVGAKESGREIIEIGALHTRGFLYKKMGRYGEAQEYLTEAAERSKIAPAVMSLALSVSGYNSLLLGDLEGALDKTEKALEWAVETPESYMAQASFWYRYVALQRAAGDPLIAPDENWVVLEQACQKVLTHAGNIQDEGLRRSYLKAQVGNPEIIVEWARQAHRRGLPLGSLLEHQPRPGIDQDPFNRLLAFGTRLTSQRDPGDLPEFILDEFVELSGAERAFLALDDEKKAGAPGIVQVHGLQDEESADLLETVAPLLSEALVSRHFVLSHLDSTFPEHDPAEIHRRSVLVIPLVLSGQALGVLYADNREVFGAFTRQDADLLTILGNQAAAALENARWTQGLEQKVAERTAELKMRVEELSIINAVQAALTEELDIHGIYEAVGEKLREIFDVQTISIYVADMKTRTLKTEYVYEKGQRLESITVPFNSLYEYSVRQDRTIIRNGDFPQFAAQFKDYKVPIGEIPKSVVIVPIPKSKDPDYRVYLSLQDMDGEKVFTDSDIHLLETLASSISVALENARLFKETNRLLKGTEQQAAELATVNRVSQALVAEPNLESLIQIAGEQLRQIFDADITYVALLDPSGKQIQFPYQYGEEFTTIPFGEGLTSKIIESGEPLLINQDIEERRLALGATRVGKEALSYLGVPIVLDRQAIGAISVQSTQRENSYTEADVRLLSTIAANVSSMIRIANLFEEINHARQEAIQANQAKSAFLANMSHELRTPLNAIIGFTRIVRRKGEGILPEKQMENLDKVLASSEHLLGLINTVLDIAKIEAGRMDVQVGSFQIKPLIELVGNTALPLIRQEKVKLVMEIDDGIPIIRSDQDKIKQILINLLSNAAKFTHEGSITVRAWEELERLHVSVADTGIGISPKAIERVFEEFQQADASTTREYGGTGLGLTISLSLARLLGGDLTVESREGVGSTFTLDVPLVYQSGDILKEETVPAHVKV